MNKFTYLLLIQIATIINCINSFIFPLVNIEPDTTLTGFSILMITIALIGHGREKPNDKSNKQ